MPGYARALGKRADGTTRWQARWRPPGEAGDRNRIEKVFRTKREATRWLTTMDADAHRGSYHDPRRGDTPFSKVAVEWQGTWADLAPKTRVGYTAILNRHVLPAFGPRKVASITTADVQQFLNGLATTHAPNTVRRVADVTRAVFRVAVERGYLTTSPQQAVKLPRRAQARTITIHPLTHGELDQLVAHLPERDRTPVLLTAYTGLRAGELWGLQRTHVDLLHATLHINQAVKEVTQEAANHTPEERKLTPSLVLGPTKTHQTRQVSIPAFLLPQLEAHLQALPTPPDTFLFRTVQGHPTRHNQWYKRVFVPAARAAFPAKAKAASKAAHARAIQQGKTEAQAAKIAQQASPCRFHDLRHTCAAWLIATGAHPLEIKLRLGHKDIQTTMNVYGHLFPNADAALAQALDTARTAALSPAAAQLAAPPSPPES